MKTLQWPSGRSVPALGQGTWNMGEEASQARREVAALQLGIDLGMTLIDTAEMYGEGGAEEIVAQAIAGRRDQVYLVSKVYPHNADIKGAQAACERSLKRMGVDSIDLYLLHWPGAVPLEETLEVFGRLQRAGKIRDYGLSNFDTDGMQLASGLPGGGAIATNQVLYNLNRRGIEWDLLPWQRARRMPLMAYSPLESTGKEHAAMLGHATLKTLAATHGATPAQIALAWVLHQDGVLAIPKASDPAHVRANRAAADIVLSAEDLAVIDQAFPPPRAARPLLMR
jgi:diketogulonate reductase-like aldo/keto reductase